MINEDIGKVRMESEECLLPVLLGPHQRKLGHHHGRV
jgi:hypothetical protein